MITILLHLTIDKLIEIFNSLCKVVVYLAPTAICPRKIKVEEYLFS
ncbi:hypothetical protein MIDIC_420009 [Alphaproteobacteria bacterium]